MIELWIFVNVYMNVKKKDKICCTWEFIYNLHYLIIRNNFLFEIKNIDF